MVESGTRVSSKSKMTAIVSRELLNSPSRVVISVFRLYIALATQDYPLETNTLRLYGQSSRDVTGLLAATLL